MTHRSARHPCSDAQSLLVGPRARGAAVLATALALLVAGPAKGADQPDQVTDGAYGRFDGDLNLSLAAGATIGPGGPSAAVLGRVIFFESAGIYAAYTDALGRAQAPLPRTLAAGVTLRPLFVPRWALDLERGPAILDLTLDAIGFDFGVIWPAKPDGSFTERPGMEAAVGTEVPILGRANGPFLGVRGALRWRASELAWRAEAPLQPILFLTLAWHGIVDANIVDAGDRRMR
jgi:hypothetical protein